MYIVVPSHNRAHNFCYPYIGNGRTNHAGAAIHPAPDESRKSSFWKVDDVLWYTLIVDLNAIAVSTMMHAIHVLNLDRAALMFHVSTK